MYRVSSLFYKAYVTGCNTEKFILTVNTIQNAVDMFTVHVCNKYLSELLDYGIKREMITREDECYIANRILNLVGAASFERVEYTPHNSLEELLASLCDIAAENGMLEQNTITYRDILSAEMISSLFRITVYTAKTE